MVEQASGLELFLSSDKAVKGANEFRVALEAAAKAVLDIGGSVDKLDKTLDRVGSAGQKAAPPVRKVGDESAAAGAKMRGATRGARDMERGLLGLSVSADRARRQFTQFALALGGLFAIRRVVSTIAESEDKLRILQSVTGATADELNRLAAAANSVTISGRASFGDATQALIELAKAGATAVEAQAALPAVADLARAGLLSMAEAAETVVHTQAQFGLSMRDSARIADVLVRAADATTSSVQSLTQSLARVGPAGQELGLSLEQVTAALAILQQNGIRAQIAGTGLGRVLKQLADPSSGPELAAEAINKLRLSFDQIDPRNFASALDNLSRSGLKLSDATKIVGTEFDQLLSVLVKNRGAVKGLEDSLNSAAGDSARKAAATVGTLGESMDQFGNAVDRLIRAGGEKGLSGFLRSVTVAGRDALNVLSGDAEAMRDAGTAGIVLANAARGAGVALAGLLTLNTIARLTSFSRAAYAAGLSFGRLTTTIRANPLGAFLSLATAAGTAFALFAENADKTSSALDEFIERAREAEAVAARFDAIRKQLLLAGPGAEQSQLADALREQILVAEEAIRIGQQTRIPADNVLAAIQNAAPETVGRLREVASEMVRLQEAGEKVPQALRNEFDNLNRDVLLRFGVSLSAVFGDLEGFSGRFARSIRGFDVDAKRALEALSAELNRVTGDSEAAAKALSNAAQASKELATGRRDTGDGVANARKQLDAIQNLIRERERELRLSQQSAEQQFRAKLAQDATNAAIAAGRPLRVAEILQLAVIAEKYRDITRAQRDRNVDQILQGLRDENDLLRTQGSARDALRKRQEVLNALAAQKVKEGSDEYQQAIDLLDVYEDLAAVEEGRRRSARGRLEDRREDLFRRLAQEEEALRLVGAERARYLDRVEAENEAKELGVAISAQEARAFVERRIQLGEQIRLLEQAETLWTQFGQAGTSSLERIIFEAGKLRDTLRALADELARIAFRQTVGQGINELSLLAAAALSGGGGSGLQPSGGPGGTVTPGLLAGGILPALSGVITSPTTLFRNGRAVSVAEGGAVTPEAVFPLARDERGRLGVRVIGDGAGGGNITMVFPSVRNADDARAVRATLGQRVRQLMAADNSGRRGLRPRGA